MKMIGIDLDGVLHKFSHGYQDGVIYDPPVDGAIYALHKLREAGYTVFIFTSRASSEEKKIEVREWLKKSGFIDVEDIVITNRKLPAIAYIDDRAVRFTNWSDILKYFL